MTKLERSQGFTLLEMVVAISITGIVTAMTMMFLRAPAESYVGMTTRADLTDSAGSAMRRIFREVRLALPNSIRITGTCSGTSTCFLELLETKGGGRYRVSGPGDFLDFTQADNSFDFVSSPPAISAGDFVAIYNLGVPGADAYAGDNISQVATASGVNVSFSSKLFPFESPSARAQIVSGPITFVCDPASGYLRRYSGYAIQAAQPNSMTAAPLSGANQGVVAVGVSSCLFSYDSNVTSARSGLVNFRLGLTKNGESINLYGSAHVNNIP